jgi:hypothetical protein
LDGSCRRTNAHISQHALVQIQSNGQNLATSGRVRHSSTYLARKCGQVFVTLAGINVGRQGHMSHGKEFVAFVTRRLMNTPRFTRLFFEPFHRSGTAKIFLHRNPVNDAEVWNGCRYMKMVQNAWLITG